jgi:hypothetical protein
MSNTPESPITVVVDPDPRGVSVGVWQGSHCIYSGAHPLPAAADASTAAHTYGAPAEVAARIEHYLTHNGQENSASLLLYEAMKALRAPAAGDALDAARWRFVRRKLCLTGNGDGTCAMHAINLPASIPGWPEPGDAVAEFCDAAIDAALAAQRKEDA